MKRFRKTFALAWIGVGLGMANGCQTWWPEVALTLPSPHILRHPPSYIPPSPPFPLSKELQGIEDAQKQAQDQQALGVGGQ